MLLILFAIGPMIAKEDTWLFFNGKSLWSFFRSTMPCLAASNASSLWLELQMSFVPSFA